MSETARDRIREALPHIKLAIEMAKLEVPDGTPKLAIICTREDGSGRMIASFEHNEFLDDVADVVGLKDEPGWFSPEPDEDKK